MFDELSSGRKGEVTPRKAFSPASPPHVVSPSPQVVAVDLDEGLNGLVAYRMQVGLPRMDFVINSTSGVVTTTAELDRERIAEYQLRVVASDAGTPTKSSTSTLTIRGEGCLLLGAGSGTVPPLTSPTLAMGYLLRWEAKQPRSDCLCYVQDAN